ncbi:unnamed protein product, partial [Ectocarpus sp. 4 AP-2014]
MAEVLNSPKTTLFSDKHKSHEPAITLHAPNTVWRWCLRHDTKALPEAPGQTVTHWLYHAARAPTRTKFMDIMDAKVKPMKPKACAALLDPNKPHELIKWTHHAGPSDTAIGSVVSSNAPKQNMAMVGLQGRKLPPYNMAKYILDKTTSQMAERAELCNSTSQRFTPYAAKGSILGLGFGDPALQRHRERQLHCSQTRQQLRQLSGAGVRGRWRGDSHDLHSDEVMSSIDPAYHLDTYRALHTDSRFEVQLPVPDELTVDVDILPPDWVPNQAGRPKEKGPSRMKRITSSGEHASSSSSNVRLIP